MLSIRNVISEQRGAIARPLTIATLCCISLVYAASFSSGVYNEYIYNYEVNVASGPNGFRFKAKASIDILYVSKGPTSGTDIDGETDSLLVHLKLTEPVFFAGPDNNQPHPLVIHNKYKNLYNPDYSLYAHIVTLSNGTAIIKEIYTHQSDATTFKNIKKSILLNILPTNHHLSPQANSYSLSSSQQQQHQQHQDLVTIKPICSHDNNLEQPELFSPDSISHVNIFAKPKKQTPELTTASNSIKQINVPIVFQSVEGYQNVTFRSRVFSQAESNLTTTFHLELVDQVKSNAHEKFDQANSMEGAIKLLDRQKYQVDTIGLERERRVCSHHHCGKTLLQYFQDYRNHLTDDSMASVDAAIAFLRILDRLRESEGTSVQDILSVLKKSKHKQGIESSFLDVLAAARTKESILAALKHLKLTKNDNLNTAERFLSVLSVAVKTASKMHLKRPLQSPYYFTPTKALKRSHEAKGQQSRLASLEFIANEFLNMIEKTPANRWAEKKIRWSTLLTLATVVNANNQENNFENINDELNLKVEKLLLDELNQCHDPSDTEGRIVAIQAIGNVGRLGEKQFQALKDQVLRFGRRESNSAMKVLRDLMQNQAKDKPMGQEFYTNLKDFLLRIVYDNSQETTSRVLAAEMIVRFVPNTLASEELLNHLPSFGNNELATMIYSRMQSLRPDSLSRHHENWYWKSCIINGTSTSFIKTMARTESLNASYGVNVELLNKGKVFKESSFDVLLDTKQRTQDLFSLGIFARGLSSFANGNSGDDSDGATDEDEATMAGMTLKLLGGYLRPSVFFTGIGELMSHIWAGTASEPTTAFNGDLILIDHEEGYPLISGFVAEQQMRGVLSIDVSGRVKVSWLWNRYSNSVVTTKAAVLVQASQSVYTVYDKLWHSHLFSFGGKALIDFIADAYFTPMPVRTCLQVTQPEFIVRYNSRRHEQMMTNEVTRKVTRRTLSIGAKSYSLNSENNKMCSELKDDL